MGLIVPEQYEFTGDISTTVTHKGWEDAVILRFLRGGEVVTEIHLTTDGAKRLAAALRWEEP